MDNQQLYSKQDRCERLERRPNHFTHQIIQRTPFYCIGMQQGSSPDGELKEGEKVLLYADEGAQAWIVTNTGVLVAVSKGDLIGIST